MNINNPVNLDELNKNIQAAVFHGIAENEADLEVIQAMLLRHMRAIEMFQSASTD